MTLNLMKRQLETAAEYVEQLENQVASQRLLLTKFQREKRDLEDAMARIKRAMAPGEPEKSEPMTMAAEDGPQPPDCPRCPTCGRT